MGSGVFFDDEDQQTYLKLLTGYARKHDLQIWAYCLMDNHVHLLAVPETETSLARGIVRQVTPDRCRLCCAGGCHLV